MNSYPQNDFVGLIKALFEPLNRGSLWFSEISDELKEISIGIVCLTKENKDKPWILFEAGALAKGLSSSRVCTLLIDLQPTDLDDPLAQFNHTFPTKEGIRSLVRTLNSSLGELKLKETIIDKVFETNWPEFETRFNSIINGTPQTSVVPTKKNPDDILLEILNSTRNLEKRIRSLEFDNKNINTNYPSKSIKPRSMKQIEDYIFDLVSDNCTLEEIMEKTENMDIPKDLIRAIAKKLINNNLKYIEHQIG